MKSCCGRRRRERPVYHTPCRGSRPGRPHGTPICRRCWRCSSGRTGGELAGPGSVRTAHRQYSGLPQFRIYSYHSNNIGGITRPPGLSTVLQGAAVLLPPLQGCAAVFEREVRDVRPGRVGQHCGAGVPAAGRAPFAFLRF